MLAKRKRRCTFAALPAGKESFQEPGNTGCGAGKKKKKDFVFLLAESEKVLTFAAASSREERKKAAGKGAKKKKKKELRVTKRFTTFALPNDNSRLPERKREAGSAGKRSI
ncbi:hypothetical protein [Pontibacter chitinilyticus]|uniref:hypothetical protein n=1 Tax=Pontibacter chitinilyticus TaxID=2674989 RepID=UPI00321A4E48